MDAISASAFPRVYRLFFLYVEPFFTLVGAIYAHYLQNEYLQLTYASASTALLGPSIRESIVLTQLANMYLAFAINEALVLRATTDLRVWKAFLFVLLIADFGHLYSVRIVGPEVYWQFWKWSSMYWGNLGFVYVGASLRIAFLSGVGISRTATKNKGT